MSNAPDLDAAGLPEELSPLDQILHRGEANPRTRSGIMTVELLDTTPDWDRFRTRFEHASRKVLRLRQKVVTPTLPTAAPRWVVARALALYQITLVMRLVRAEIERVARGGRR